MNSDYYTPAEAAPLVGCSKSHVYKLCDRGELYGHRVGGKVMIDRSAVEVYIKARLFGKRTRRVVRLEPEPKYELLIP